MVEFKGNNLEIQNVISCIQRCEILLHKAFNYRLYYSYHFVNKRAEEKHIAMYTVP